MEKRLWRVENELFSDIYEYDKGVREKIEKLINSDECVQLVEKAKSKESVLLLMDEVIPDKKDPSIKRIFSMLNPFYNRGEYRTKEDYLQYLKYAYGFMLSPLEVPPGMVLGLFYPGYKRAWSPSQDSAEELFTKFYVEAKLIKELTPTQWKEVASSKNPETKIAELLFGTRFKPDFMDFLKKIPWIMSEDVYGSPGLDIIYRRAPGQEMPKKPFGVGEGFLTNLVTSSQNNQTYTLIEVGEESVRLQEKSQITNQIEAEGSATIDSFVGMSKIERDFVIHQRIIIWYNPGFEKYEKASFIDRLVYAKPSRFLCVFREQALPLEIPFLERKFDEHEGIMEEEKENNE